MNMFNTEDFDYFYTKNPNSKYSASLLNFYLTNVSHLVKRNFNVLEVGSGPFSVFEDVDDPIRTITAIDFSKVAIESAPKSKINYLQVSLLDKSFFNVPSYDLVFDSHCLNCIPAHQFEIALKNIFKVIKPSGIFASEIMVQPTRKKVSCSQKTILECREIESMLIKAGFNIYFFTVSSTNNFEVNGFSVDLLRFIAIK